MQTATIVRTRTGAMAGRIEGKTFIKDVYSSKHMLRKPAAWSIDTDIFDRVIFPLCYIIQVNDKETGKIYRIGTGAFREKAQVLDRGYGKQYYLELIHWNII